MPRQIVITAGRVRVLAELDDTPAAAAIGEALAAGETVVISSFGRFEVRAYPGRRLRRFDGPGHYTGEDRRVPVFKSSAALRRRVKGGSS
mgnify:CR=1 FL=1